MNFDLKSDNDKTTKQILRRAQRLSHLKTQNVEELSLDPIFHTHLVNKLKLRIHYKPDRNQSKLTVCTGERFGFEGAGRRRLSY